MQTGFELAPAGARSALGVWIDIEVRHPLVGLGFIGLARRQQHRGVKPPPPLGIAGLGLPRERQGEMAAARRMVGDEPAR